MQRFVPDFEMVVDDIAKVTDDELDARGLPPEVALTLWALRDGRSPESLLHHAPFWAPVVARLDGSPDAVEALLGILSYLGEAAGERSVDLEQLAERLTEHSPNAQDITMTSLERLLDKGRKQGLEQGLEQGREQGLEQGLEQGRLLERREMLLELLQEKFGEPTDAEKAKVDAADAETLARYIKRVVRADSIAAVLGD